MISLVTCSVDPGRLAQLKDNIGATIGVPYELIAIDNRPDPKGICERYNEGLAAAKFDVIAFCHDDILFQTNGWGSQLWNLLQAHPQIGLVGTAGAVYKSRTPTSWVDVPYKYYRANMIQQHEDGSVTSHIVHDAGDYSEVAVIDGCFIAGRKAVFQKYCWNETLLTGFHLYDLDICLRVGQHYKVAVSNQLLIRHASEGEFNEAWLRDSQRVHRQYRRLLPVSKTSLQKREKLELEYYALHAYTRTLLRLKQPASRVLPAIWRAFWLFPLRKQNLSLLIHTATRR
jgi:glycosyltransferase involved in cell wall biosynthesis